MSNATTRDDGWSRVYARRMSTDPSNIMHRDPEAKRVEGWLARLGLELEAVGPEDYRVAGRFEVWRDWLGRWRWREPAVERGGSIRSADDVDRMTSAARGFTLAAFSGALDSVSV